MKRIFALVLALALLLLGCQADSLLDQDPVEVSQYKDLSVPAPTEEGSIADTSGGIGDKSFVAELEEIPEFSDSPYVVLNDNIPYFADEDIRAESWEYYSDLDDIGRCGAAIACIGRDIMPTEPRGEIGSVKPTGWQTVKYDNVDGKYLYNRCHLIGFQLTGENANNKNLVTGTRYMNVVGMLPFENMVADYVKETENHVLYRVTPVFDGENLVCHGVWMEAYSVEDEGDGICFNVFCYNAQPDIAIDYATGDSEYCPEIRDESVVSDEETAYVLNTSSKKFHRPNCSSVATINPENRADSSKSRDELMDMGYSPCGNCKP